MVTALLRFCGLAWRADLIRAERHVCELLDVIRHWQDFVNAAAEELARLDGSLTEPERLPADQHTCH